MRLLKTMLLLLALLAGSAAAKADYNPTNPPEPGVYFTLTTRCIPQDGGYNLTSSGTHAFGSNVYLNVYPNTGYRFTGWKDEDGNVLSTSTSFNYTMPSKDVTVTATFVYDPSNPTEPSTPVFKNESKIEFVTNPADAGYFSGNYNGTYEVGTNHNFYVYAHNGYRFANWTRDGAIVGTASHLVYNVPKGDHTLVANFEYDPDSPGEPGEQHFYRKLTLVSNPKDAATLYGAGEYLDGSSRNYVHMNVNDYYTFVNWTDENGEVFSESKDFYLTMPNRNLTLTANFTYNYDPSNPGEPGTPNPDGSVAKNMVAKPRFGMYDNTHVQILCETKGSTIHYTLDETDPTAASPVYTSPVYVGSNLLVKAIAYKEGMEDSPVVSYRVTAYKTQAPVYTFENKMVKITSETPGAVIRYTLDFTEPNAESEVYTGPFVPEENCRIKAYASKEGLTDSPVSIYVYRRAEHTLPAPTFSLNGEGKLVITPPVRGGKTYYTTDGNEPTESSTQYSGPITLTQNCTVKAYTVHINYFDSPVADYEVTGFANEAPAIAFENKRIKITCATEGAEIRYTLDGKEPTAESTLYTAPFLPAGDCTVKAIAIKAGMNNSKVTDYVFTRAEHTLPLPTFSLNGEGKLVITSAVADVEIRYTLNSTEPNASSPLYTEPITLTRNCTVKAYSTHKSLLDSPVADYVVNTFMSEAPAIAFENKMIRITCATEGATIRYTVDGNEPTAESTLYTAPFLPAGDCTVKAIAIKEGMNNSKVTDYVFTRAEHTLPMPTFSLNGEGKLVITSAVADVEIRYTLNSTEPNASSPLYTEPITLTRNCTVKAYSTNASLLDSPVADYVVNTFTSEAPAIAFENKMIRITCATEGAEIRYTLDGKEPTAESTLYTAPFLPAGDCTVKAIAIKEGMNNSKVTDYVFTRAEHTLPMPTFSLNGEGKLVITSAVADVEIRYTMDSTEPNASSPLYTAPLTLTQNCTVKAYSTHKSLLDSPVADYVVDTFTSDAPKITFENRKITIACAIEGAVIRYTLDEKEPTAESTLYTAPFLPANDCTVKAFASKEGMNDSPSTSYVYRRAEHTLPAPTFGLNGEGKLVIAEAVPGSEIRFTTDETEPNATSSLYTDPITLTRNCTVRAYSSHPNYFDSPVADYVVDTFTSAAPTIAFEDKKIAITSATEDAMIRYTLDGIDMAEGTQTIDGAYSISTAGTTVARDLAAIMFLTPTGENTCTITAPDVTFDLGRGPVNLGDIVVRSINITETGGMKSYTGRAEGLKLNGGAITADAELNGTIDTDGNADFKITVSWSSVTIDVNFTGHTGSIFYAGPFLPGGDCTIKAIASKEGMNDSPETSYVYRRGEHTIAAPTFALNEAGQLVITSSVADGETRYTMDGSHPNATSPLYTAPITLTRNCTVKAYTTNARLLDSPVARYVVDTFVTEAPAIDFEDRMITITCATEEASIRYTLSSIGATADPEGSQTIDGSYSVATFGTTVARDVPATLLLTPTSESTCTLTAKDITIDLGRGPVNLGDIVVPGINIAETEGVKSYTGRADGIKLNGGAITASAELNGTVDADGTADFKITLRWSAVTVNIDFTGHTGGILYSGPFLPANDCTVKAYASKEGMKDSPVTSYVYIRAEHTVPAPTFALNEAKRLVIVPAMSGCESRYTTDGTEPEVSSRLYTEPIVLPDYGSVKAYSTLDNYFDSPVVEYVIAEHQEMPPTITADFRERVITIEHPDSLRVALTIDGETIEIETPHTMDVYPGMAYVSAVSLTEDADKLNSLPEGMELIFHERPELHFDGHTVYAAISGGDPMQEYADGILLFNGEIVSGGGPVQHYDVSDFGTAMSVVISDHAFRSDVAGMDIDFFNTGRKAGARNGHRLQEAFEDWGAGWDSTCLEVVGEVARADLQFISTLSELTSLRLNPDFITAENCDSVLAESRIETICSTAYPAGMLKGMQRLTTVMWPLGDANMPAGRIFENGNPNILFWTTNSANAPEDARNIVVYSSIDGAFPDKGEAEEITLEAGYPFNAHRPVEAKQVVFSKLFGQETVPGKCQGWETIALPFTPDRMFHESGTEIMPFSLWPGVDEAPRPFWLYTAAEGSDWQPAERIIAGMPYIISMPNNPDYIYYYNLAGRILFMASDVTLGTEDSAPLTTTWKSRDFTATFMPVEERGILSLNVNGEENGVSGSRFVPDAETLPFGAYAKDSGSLRSIPVFDDSGIALPSITESGLAVDSPAPGTIRISSLYDCRVAVTAITGITVATADVRAGETVRVDGLAKGLYIVAGKKIMVK